jgi:MoxR-like ATPase
MSNGNSTDLAHILDLVPKMSNAELPAGEIRGGDRRDGRVYAYTQDIVLALQVALITSRPLLLSGPPGCGKSSLAGYVARNLGFAYYEYVVTDDSNPRDLLWRMDVIRRLNDAQTGSLRKGSNGHTPLLDYIEPGPLWWALNPGSARHRNLDPAEFAKLARAELRAPQLLPDHEPTRPGAVLLIDEIDKADSTFCNGLLVPLGSRQFSIAGVDAPVFATADQPPYSPLVIITTNNETELPEAFVRRCVALPIPRPAAHQLVDAALLHYPDLSDRTDVVMKVRTIAQRFETEAESASGTSTAEFLDLVGTLRALPIELDSDEWTLLQRLVVEKPSARGMLPVSRRNH